MNMMFQHRAVKPWPCRACKSSRFRDPSPPVRTSGSPHDDCLRPLGTILRPLAEGLFEVSLPNGKKVTSHLSKELAASPPELPAGTVVLLEISPYDLDRARIARVESAPATS
jgi:translation initiation factor IF-1